MAKIHPDASKLINKYIREAPAFAQPICRKLREIIRQADREIAEDWKWGPNFNKKGMVCGFGAFKQHVSLAFFMGAMMKDPQGILTDGGANRHNRLLKFKASDEVDEKTLTEYVKEAVQINEQELQAPPAPKTIHIPKDIRHALAENETAWKNFNNFAYTYRKEYVEWVQSAKRPETREKRIKETVRLSALNKKMNEQYMR